MKDRGYLLRAIKKAPKGVKARSLALRRIKLLAAPHVLRFSLRRQPFCGNEIWQADAELRETHVVPNYVSAVIGDGKQGMGCHKTVIGGRSEDGKKWTKEGFAACADNALLAVATLDDGDQFEEYLEDAGTTADALFDAISELPFIDPANRQALEQLRADLVA